MDNRLNLHAFGKTDVGKRRDHNEDYFAFNNRFFIVADGMGGHKAGEVASKLTVDTLLDYQKTENVDNKDFLKNAIEYANNIVNQKSLIKSDYSGMGCTLVAGLFTEPNVMHIANVGDARIYLLRDEELTVLTEDHSVVGDLVRSGELTWEKARVHPLRNHITRAIGTQQSVQPFFSSIGMQNDDLLVLCSDGLWDMLPDNNIRQLLQNKTNLEKTCISLIDAANAAGGYDNITVIILQYNEK